MYDHIKTATDAVARLLTASNTPLPPDLEIMLTDAQQTLLEAESVCASCTKHRSTPNCANCPHHHQFETYARRITS